MAQTRLKSGNLHMIGGDNGTSGNVLKSKGDGTMEWGAATTPPTFSSVDYPGDDTALDPAGGQNLVINGGGFATGINVKIGGTTATSVTVNSATQITVVTPAKSAGTYAIEFTNTDGGNATANAAVSYNGIPAFTHNAGSLGSFKQGTSVSVSVVATEPDGGAITHTVSAGSLPSGLSLNATTGAITGTAPDVTASTTSSFTITATDNENQSTSRAYSIQVDPILPSDDFNVLTYTGNGGTQSITGLSFRPDFVWIKKRNGDAEQLLNHPNVGIGEYYRPSYNSAGRLTNSDTITALNNNGFTLGSNSQSNANNDTFVAYCWKVNGGTTVSNTDGTTTSTVQVNADKGISMINYGGAGANRTVGHGLGKIPELFFMMDRYNGGGWRMWHKDLDNADKYLEMGTGGQQSSGSIWQGTKPTSSVFYLGNVAPPNGSGRQHVCWAFTSIAGHSKFDSYGGNGSSAGPIVELGFKPALLIIRRIDSGDHFYMFDSKRETKNPRNVALFMNSSGAESTGNLGTGVDFLSNGFQVTSTDSGINANNGKYIYMAWAQDPDATAPSLADSFSTKAYSGTGSTQNVTGLGFSPNLTWLKERTGTDSHQLYDTVRGPNKVLYPNGTNAQYSGSEFPSFDADGFTISGNSSNNENGQTYIAWNWKANDDEPTMLPNAELSSLISKYKYLSNTNDSFGANDGVPSNISYVSGQFDRGADFNGSSSKILYPQAAPFNDSNTIKAISAWVKLDAASNEFIIMSASSTSDSGDMMILVAGGNRAGRVFLGDAPNNSNEYQATFGSSNNTNWNHYVWQLSASGGIELWYNGTKQTRSTLVETGTMDATKWFGDLTYATSVQYATGINRVVTTAYSNGSIDQMRLFNAELTSSQISALYNEAQESIVSANTNAGISIVKYRGTGVATSKFEHGLGGTPEMIIHKRIDGVSGWIVNHHNLSNGYETYLQTTGAQTNSMGNDGGMPNGTQSATTLSFQAGASTTNNVNTDGAGYIAYCFRGISGFSKFGTYEGGKTLNTDNVVDFGFAANFVIIKNIDEGSSQWMLLDTVRTNGMALYSNSNSAESNYTSDVTISSQGLRFGSTNINVNKASRTYIYAAFKIN